jgi:pyruvate/2-oxoglutarate dehydrogenase complex dihydrolipoamide acyltransferase (E2) component
MRATWKPHEKHGRLTMQSDLPSSVFAFPKQRKEPLTDARHVRNAVARMDQVMGVSNADRSLAFANIRKAARHYGIDLSESSWQDLGVHPQPRRKQSARKGAATRKRTGVAKSAARKAARTRAKRTRR